MIDRETADEITALLSGAARLSRAGDHVTAIPMLQLAVALGPDHLAAHRRLAAAYAVTRDRDAARGEYERYTARLESHGAFDAAAVERSYQAAVLAPPDAAPRRIATPATQRLTADQAFALRRIAVAIIAIGVALTAMFAAGAQIFASGGPL